ncbi:MAG: N-acetylmuramoyl-L-alanine amidase [Nitrospirota bacterium]|jgi:N-acetylmuramoyl-L-alanine amidase
MRLYRHRAACIILCAFLISAFSFVPAFAGGASCLLNDIRYWSSENYTRVVIDLSDQVSFRKGRLRNPDRLYLDLSGSALPGEAERSIEIGEGPLKGVRAAQFDPRTVRVVLDLEGVEDFKVFTLDGPPRLVVDIHGGPGGKAKTGGPPAAEEMSDAEKAAAVEKIANARSVEKRKWLPAEKAGLDIRRPRVVVVDPGHGGHDPGATGPNGIREKDIVLDVAKQLKNMLEAKGDYEVYLTRDRDVYLSLEERTVIANRKDADLFVSVHANAHDSRNVRGLETYFLNYTNEREALKVAARENKISVRRMQKARSEREVILASLQLDYNVKQSLELANYVQGAMVSEVDRWYTGVRDLGVKNALFYVLVGAKMPSVLVEVSFITNPVEAGRLKSQSYRRRIAEGISSGIEEYFAALPAQQKVAMRY